MIKQYINNCYNLVICCIALVNELATLEANPFTNNCDNTFRIDYVQGGFVTFSI